jgi:hypothetical protein
MTLNAGVVGVHRAEAAWIEDSVSHRTRDVSTPRAMATFAADIPLADGLCIDVVVHRVTAIAQRPSRPLEIVRRIERCPPIGSIRVDAAPLSRSVPVIRLTGPRSCLEFASLKSPFLKRAETRRVAVFLDRAARLDAIVRD